MSYEVHNFVGGEKLYAVQLNEMDSQIKSTSDAVSETQDALRGIYYTKSIPVTIELDPQASTQNGKYYQADMIGSLYTDALVTNERSFYSAEPYDVKGMSGQITIVLSAVGEFHTTSGRYCLFVDDEGLIIAQRGPEKNIFSYDSVTGKYTAVMSIPKNASGFVWSLNLGDVFESITLNGYEIITTRRDSSEDKEITKADLMWNASILYNKYYSRGFVGQAYQLALATNGNYKYAETPIDVSQYIGFNVVITLSAVGAGHATAGGGACLFINSSGIIISDTEPEKNLYRYDTASGKYIAKIPIPDGADGFLWAMQRDNTIESIGIEGTRYVRGISPRTIAYVSTTGSDDNYGSFISPYASVTKALEAGYRDIRVFGGKYEQIIDLSNVSTDDCGIKISAVEHNNPVVFVPPGNIAKITSATAYSVKVYQATITDTILSDCKYIYMDGVPDPRTEIEISDRHPAQRGNFYRCPDIVRISKCNSVADIESSDDYLWYLNGTTLYFSAPTAPSANSPIVYAHTQAVTLFMLNDTVSKEPQDDPERKFSIELNAIETRFMQMNLKCFQTAVARNCRVVASPLWTGIALNRTQYVELVNCESCCASIDGFGGQNINTSASNPTAHNSFSRLINCWSHDNYDDGYSEHDRSESVIIGGLFEWNGKAGITPSYSEVCTCIDVYSRHNYQGFAMVGPASGESGHTNGRNGSTLICYGCVSDSNTRGTQKKGFVVANNNNSAIFVNCVAMNELRGFCALGDVHMKLIDCRVVSCDADKYTEGSPTVEVITGTAVTA